MTRMRMADRIAGGSFCLLRGFVSRGARRPMVAGVHRSRQGRPFRSLLVMSLACSAICVACGPGASSDGSLHGAVRLGDASQVRSMLDQGLDIGQRDATGRTALHLAAERGDGELVALLLSRGAEGLATTSEGATPLDLAAAEGHAEVVVRLLESEGRFSPKSVGGWTPLHGAAHGGHPALVEVLLAQGELATESAERGVTPLYLAAASDCADCVLLRHQRHVS